MVTSLAQRRIKQPQIPPLRRPVLERIGFLGVHAIILPVRKGEIMETVATTRMSSKGQVVIPEAIRKRLNLEEGAQFVVVGDADVIILKAISQPDLGEFDALIQQARQQAKMAGLKRKDIQSAVAKARGRA
jgi:AbrB family looped-hinge helix DNA binding protein